MTFDNAENGWVDLPEGISAYLLAQKIPRSEWAVVSRNGVLSLQWSSERAMPTAAEVNAWRKAHLDDSPVTVTPESLLFELQAMVARATDIVALLNKG